MTSATARRVLKFSPVISIGVFSIGVIANACYAGHAWAMADSVVCAVPHIPLGNASAGQATPKKTLIYIENLSQREPQVAIYGHQVSTLHKRLIGPKSYEFDSKESKYHVTYDQERMRIIIGLKTTHDRPVNPADTAVETEIKPIKTSQHQGPGNALHAIAGNCVDL